MEIFSNFLNRIGVSRSDGAPKKHYPNLSPLKKDTLCISKNAQDGEQQDVKKSTSIPEEKEPIEKVEDVKFEPLTDEELLKLHEGLMETVNLIEDESLRKSATSSVRSVSTPQQAKVFLSLLKYKQKTGSQDDFSQLWYKMSMHYVQHDKDVEVIEKLINMNIEHPEADIVKNSGSMIYGLKSQSDHMASLSDSNNHSQRCKVALDVLSIDNFHKAPEFFIEAFYRIVFSMYGDIEDTDKLKLDLLKTIGSHDDLYLDKEFTDKATEMFLGGNSKKQIDGKKSLITSFLEMEEYKTNPEFKSKALDFIFYTNSEEQANVIKTILTSEQKLYKNEYFMENFTNIVYAVQNPYQEQFAQKMLTSPIYYENDNLMQSAKKIFEGVQSEADLNLKTKFIDEALIPILNQNKNNIKYLGELLFAIQNPYQEKVARKLLSSPDFYANEDFMKSISEIMKDVQSDEDVKIKSEFIDEVLLPKLSEDKDYKGYITELFSLVKTKDDIKYIKKIAFDKNITILPNQLVLHLEKPELAPVKLINKLNKKIGIEDAKQLTKNDTYTAIEFFSLLGIHNTNEIPLSKKKILLRKLVASNTGLFSQSEIMHKHFPLLPKNQEEYCSILPAMVRSLGIETKPLTEEEINNFNASLSDLGDALKNIGDTVFNNLNITQEYSKEDFIKDVLSKMKDLSNSEKQKVFDYYGFELKLQKQKDKEKEREFYSIYGYPVNLNNGEKLSQITNPKTKEVIESLRENVIHFSEENYISCNSPRVEMALNEIVELLPELRTTIGRTQSKSHYYDVMTHSLKVLRKIAENPKFKKLNESDKKIMFLAALLHDVTKAEGKTDSTHPNEGSFDAFFITKKFNLTKDEEIKLYSLIKYHEWLSKINTAKTEEERQKEIHNTAYDLRHDNLFELSLMFTHADLKSIRSDDSFHTSRKGDGRTNFEGITRSFGEAAEVYAKDVRSGIEELKKSQPLLPITKIPTADVIASKVVRNSDGTTNIKGVYIDDNGLVVIKYNEVEDFEAIGFPKGSISKGIKTTTDNGVDIDTGNIKFIAHGLDYSNQLAKFDAFGLIDSDALLSVSYVERPESKYRLFRAQGVLLDVDTKYVHGGGNTDSGSGFGKDIQNFKDRYIFGAERENDRLYISELIKKATGMNDKEYIDFVNQYENKSFTEIEPKETREAIIKIFASINSNKRKGNREYNEMYISNPTPVAVFAYDMHEKSDIGNPIQFLNSQERNPIVSRGTSNSNLERTGFLQKYAREHNLPFIVFGD